MGVPCLRAGTISAARRKSGGRGTGAGQFCPRAQLVPRADSALARAHGNSGLEIADFRLDRRMSPGRISSARKKCCVRMAEKNQFDVFLTGDRNLMFQQNTTQCRVAVVVLEAAGIQCASYLATDAQGAGPAAIAAAGASCARRTMKRVSRHSRPGGLCGVSTNNSSET